MVFLTSTSINSKFDTLSEHLTNICNGALTTSNYKELNDYPNQWNDYYIKILLHMYTGLIGEDTINFKIINQTLQEPIIWYKKNFQDVYKTRNSYTDNNNSTNNNNNNNNGDDEEDTYGEEEFDPRTIEHVLSLNFIKNLFSIRYPTEFEVRMSRKRLEEFKLPPIFKINNSVPNYDEHPISAALTNKLLMLYVIANHASYHYNQFKATNNVDFAHNNIDKIPLTENNVFYLHNLFTKKPNRKIHQYVSDQHHQVVDCGTGSLNDLEEMFVFEKKHQNNDNNSDCSTSTDGASSNSSSSSSEEE